jgi:hypothetical protein
MSKNHQNLAIVAKMPVIPESNHDMLTYTGSINLWDICGAKITIR